MPKAKKIKRNLYTTLKKFALWLNKVGHEPCIAASLGKKSPKIFKNEIDPTKNVDSYIKQLTAELNLFISALTLTLHHEKLAKESKKKLETFDLHITESWHHTEDLPRGSINALNALQKRVQTSLKKVNSLLKKILASKEKGKTLHIHPSTHLASEKRFKVKQAPNKTYRTHLNILKIATKKRAGF